MLDLKNIKAISLDLDDTLWPVWPVIERAEKALADWLRLHAPGTAVLFADPAARQEIREHVFNARPELMHDMSAVRRESIRLALGRSSEDTLLTDHAFDVFFAERNRVVLFEDALPALEFLSARYPIVALSNGNADIGKIGIDRYFQARISAQQFGVGKPDQRIFHAAARALNVLPVEVLHIGDDAMLDVLGALDAGMKTAWLNRAGVPWSHAEVPHVTLASLHDLCNMLVD